MFPAHEPQFFALHDWDAKYKLTTMAAIGLPARAAYAAGALVIGSFVGFRAGVILFGRLMPMLHGVPPTPEYSDFLDAIAVGAVIGFTACLLALTLPWIRRKKRRGRMLRTIVSGVFVFVAAIALATQNIPALEEVSILAWVILTLSYTFVRYGLRDQARRLPSNANIS